MIVVEATPFPLDQRSSLPHYLFNFFILLSLKQRDLEVLQVPGVTSCFKQLGGNRLTASTTGSLIWFKASIPPRKLYDPMYGGAQPKIFVLNEIFSFQVSSVKTGAVELT